MESFKICTMTRRDSGEFYDLHNDNKGQWRVSDMHNDKKGQWRVLRFTQCTMTRRDSGEF